jgi:hypothetical protein
MRQDGQEEVTIEMAQISAAAMQLMLAGGTP